MNYMEESNRILLTVTVQATEHCVTFIINSLYFVCFNLIISCCCPTTFHYFRSPGVCWQLIGQLLAHAFQLFPC